MIACDEKENKKTRLKFDPSISIGVEFEHEAPTQEKFKGISKTNIDSLPSSIQSLEVQTLHSDQGILVKCLKTYTPTHRHSQKLFRVK
ncbi:hypothetical protein QR98_0044630 [Sarcoptes scabiei]|uniref:Uncharacterized protein n=1 Tax=Sarcoptes scabiei TaxID=52283 RepID=A0A132A6F9_SARSC|nr:hypothetical protein QR98_0044630 [Sarcoptes scabiei]